MAEKSNNIPKPVEQDDLVNQIEESQTSSEIREATLSGLKEAKRVIESNKKLHGWNTEKYQEIVNEYEELRLTTAWFVKSEWIITQAELTLFQKDLKEMILDRDSNKDWDRMKTRSELKRSFIAVMTPEQRMAFVTGEKFEEQILIEMEQSKDPKVIDYLERLAEFQDQEEVYKENTEKYEYFQENGHYEWENSETTKKAITSENGETNSTLLDKYESKYTIISKSDNSILTEAWEIWGLSTEEMLDVQRHPESLDNLVNFYTFFKEINLPGVFIYRKEFITAAGTKDINLEDNSLSKEELTLFGRKLIKLINNIKTPEQEELVDATTFEWVDAELRKYSEAGSYVTDGKTHGLNWEWKLVNSLRNLWLIGENPPFKTLEISKLMNT